MSAPQTRDPMVVNTQDGCCWTRRAVNREGRGLYALADVPGPVPELVLASLRELAEHGLSSMSMDALPMPVGAEPERDVEDELTGARLSLWEEEQDNARLRLALESAKRGRRELRSALQFSEPSRERWRAAAIEAEAKLGALRSRVAGLETERRSTNRALSDADVWLAADRDRIAELEGELRAARDRIAELEAQRERRRLRLVALQNDALDMRGSLSPMGEDRKVPFPLGETLTPAVDWLIARIAELEALTPARHQTCRVCGAGYVYGEPCAQCAFRARMAAETQARVRQPGLVGHDLPPLGGQL